MGNRTIKLIDSHIRHKPEFARFGEDHIHCNSCSTLLKKKRKSVLYCLKEHEASNYHQTNVIRWRAKHFKQYPQNKRFLSNILFSSNRLHRTLLLLFLISISCLLLWQLYTILVDGHNYLGEVETPSVLGTYEQYAVSTDAKPCAKIGKDLLAKGGSAVDAAIGTLLCMGIVIPNSLGLGGGCLMTIYDANKKEAIVIDGREIAPDYASEDMFAGDSMKASRGPLSVGIPGELAAYWKAHQLFGKLKWSELFDANIELAEKGVPVVEHLAYALKAKNHVQYITPPMSQLFTNNETGQHYNEGEVLVQKELADTLKRIKENGAKEFYGGLTGQLFVDDLARQGGNISLANLMKYEALVKKPLVFKLADDLTLHTQPLPGSGIVLSIILRIMKELGYYKGHKPQQNFEDAALYYHRLVESFKIAYAQRAGLEDKPDDPMRMEQLMEKLSSQAFITEAASKIDNQTHDEDYYGNNYFSGTNHGTAHVSVVDAEGNAAAVTSSVNLYFGSGFISPSTGIIYNDVMDDFVSPNLVNKFNLQPSKYNRIRPGKRPLSSMAPSVFTDEAGNVRLVLGGSGGSKITTAIASVALRHSFLEEDIKTSVDGPRLHHQFLPNEINYELNFPKDLLYALKQYGHKERPILDRSSVIMAIASDQCEGRKLLTANSDYRKGGSVDGV